MSADCIGTGCKAEALLKRIKELESALCEEVEARSKWYCEADKLKEELAALRKKIEDAPVVAWALTNGDVTNNESVFIAHAFQGNSATPLISKEDLK